MAQVLHAQKASNTSLYSECTCAPSLILAIMMADAMAHCQGARTVRQVGDDSVYYYVHCVRMRLLTL
jgi:hypothetical protein